MSAKLLTRPFAYLTLAHFLQALGYATLILLPLYLGHLGATRAEIGTIMAVSAVGGLLFRPAVAWSLDTWGRKPTLYAGTAVLVLAMLLIGLVDRIGPLIYLHRVLAGIGVGSLFTGYFTFAADIIPEERRTEGIALFGISGLLPVAVNPLVDAVGIEAPGLRWVLPCVGLLIALSMLPLRGIPEPPQKPERKESSLLKDALSFLPRPELQPVWWATLIFAGMVSLFMTFATVAARTRGIEDPASLWLTYTIGAICVRIFGARLPDRLGTSNLVAPATASYGAAMLLAAWGSSEWAFLAAGLFAGIGHGYCFPVLTSQVVSRAPEHLRGSALSVFTSVWSTASLMATPFFGTISDAYDDQTMFSLAAVFAAAGLVVWALLEHRAHKRSPKA